MTESKTNGLWHLTCKVIFTHFKVGGEGRVEKGNPVEGNKKGWAQPVSLLACLGIFWVFHRDLVTALN